MKRFDSDIVILGAGLAGIVAGISARRMGARVILIEKNPFPGGMATGAWVHSCLTFHGKQGHRIIGGIPGEIIEDLKNAGGTLGHIADTVGVACSVTPTDPDVFIQLLQEILEREGVDYQLSATATEVETSGQKIVSISGFDMEGPFQAKAPVFIDASGDGFLCAKSGVPFERGRNGANQPATLIFKVRNVCMEEVIDYILKNPEEFHHETRFDLLKTSPAPGVSGFFSLWKNAGLDVPRDRLLFYGTLNRDEVGINSVRVAGYDMLDPEHVQKANLMARLQVREIYRFLKKSVPGFGDSLISGIAPLIGVRETRRIKGRYTLSRKDLLRGRISQQDVALGGFPIDIHSSSGSGIEADEVGGRGFYGIPFESLLPEGIENLLMAGRCFSADFSAHASARVQATCMAMGQAVGTAGAISAKSGIPPFKIPIEEVRSALFTHGAVLSPGEPENPER